MLIMLLGGWDSIKWDWYFVQPSQT
jgi:hypothetical protein